MLEMIKEKECIHCVNFWDCKGKPKKEKGKPCLHYKENPNNPELKECE